MIKKGRTTVSGVVIFKKSLKNIYFSIWFNINSGFVKAVMNGITEPKDRSSEIAWRIKIGNKRINWVFLLAEKLE